MANPLEPATTSCFAASVALLAQGFASQWRLSLPWARVPLLSGVSVLTTSGPSGVTPSLKLELQKYKSWQSRFISVLSSRSCTDARRHNNSYNVRPALHCFTWWWPLKVKRLFSRMQFCHSFRFCSLTTEKKFQPPQILQKKNSNRRKSYSIKMSQSGRCRD